MRYSTWYSSTVQVLQIMLGGTGTCTVQVRYSVQYDTEKSQEPKQSTCLSNILTATSKYFGDEAG